MQRECALPELARDSLRSVEVEVRERDAPPVGVEPSRDRLPEPAGGAGDDRGPHAVPYGFSPVHERNERQPASSFRRSAPASGRGTPSTILAGAQR